MDIGQLIMNGFPTLGTGNIADAGKADVKVMDPAIKPLHYKMRVAGPAYTVDTPPTANVSVYEATSMAPAGSVLVVNAYGNMTAGHVGGLLSLAAQIRGIAGIVIDGAVRDVEEIIKMEYPVFARGAIPHGNSAQVGTINQPIQCAGVLVNPGDIIFADPSGIVVFPASKAKAIYDAAVSLANNELSVVNQLNQGKTLPQIPEFMKFHQPK